MSALIRVGAGRQLWCPECIVVGGIDVGDEADWEAAWDALEASS